jgi:protein TonB
VLTKKNFVADFKSGHASAFKWALAAEGTIILLLVLANYLGWLDHKPELREVMKLDLSEAPIEPKPPTPPKKIPPAPQPPKVIPPSPEKVVPPEPIKTPVVQPPEPTPFVEKPVTPPPPAPNPSRNEAILADYTSKVRAAVQAALVYPRAAEELGYTGRVRVEFRLHNGHPSDARVIISSKVSMFDRAALQAVQSASYPTPPDFLLGQSRLFQVWVEFNR